MSEDYSRLLKRQIRKYLTDMPRTPELESFLSAVNESYKHYESDRKLMQRAMDLSSEELIEKNTKLERKIEALDSFAYRVSHDLKAPAVNIQSMISLLKLKLQDADEMTLGIFGRLSTSCDSIQERITNILEYTRVENLSTANFESIALQPLVGEILASIQNLVEGAQPNISLDFSSCPEVIFPREHLYSILYNLISNAIKYRNPKRKLNLQISSALEGTFVLLKVADNGLGMDLAEAEGRLFGMFNRFHNHVEGSGMGLYIIKRLLDAHNGSISVESKPNEGSIFTIKITAETHKNHEVRSGTFG